MKLEDLKELIREELSQMSAGGKADADAGKPTKLQRVGQAATGTVKTASEKGSFAAGLENAKEQLAQQNPQQQTKSLADLLNKLGVTKEQLIALVRKS